MLCCNIRWLTKVLRNVYDQFDSNLYTHYAIPYRCILVRQLCGSSTV